MEKISLKQKIMKINVAVIYSMKKAPSNLHRMYQYTIFNQIKLPCRYKYYQILTIY